LDWLIIAGTQENEASALPRLLERFPATQVLWTGNVQASYSARQLDLWLAEHGIPVAQAEAGQKLNLGDEAFIEVTAVGERGSTLVVEWKNFRMVLPIGIDAETMANLEQGESLAPADVLLLADSGYAPSNTSNWIANLNPQLTILSVAAGDPDGLPDAETLENLAGRSLLRTDRNGWISISTDGERMRVHVEREAAQEIEVTLEPRQVSPGNLGNGLNKITNAGQ
jgi:beta-lactamase superfamily II metal-dependent hydrolase